MIKLPKEFREEWIERLESGDIHQITGLLVDRDVEAEKTGCCCLGVAQCIAWKMNPDELCYFKEHLLEEDFALTQEAYLLQETDEMKDSDLPVPLWDGSSHFSNHLTYLNDGLDPQKRSRMVSGLRKVYKGLEEWNGEARDFKFIAEFLKLNTTGV